MQDQAVKIIMEAETLPGHTPTAYAHHGNTMMVIGSWLDYIVCEDGSVIIWDEWNGEPGRLTTVDNAHAAVEWVRAYKSRIGRP